MPEPSVAEKKFIRQHCRQIRQGLGEAVRLPASREICAQIENWPFFQHARVILTYLPMKAEVDLRLLLERHPEKHWLIPRIAPEESHSMYFHPYNPARLVRHPFGMDEPAPDLPVVPPKEVQLALGPGLAFDRCGWRLGYGGGYYDRFLRDFTGLSLGISFQALLLEKLPHDEHDLPMQWLVTETGLFQAQENQS